MLLFAELPYGPSRLKRFRVTMVKSGIKSAITVFAESVDCAWMIASSIYTGWSRLEAEEIIDMEITHE